MAEFVGKDTHAAVFRLNGIVADPITGVPNAHAAKGNDIPVHGWAARTDRGQLHVPAMTPYGVRAQHASASLFTFTGMHSLEVVNIAIRFVKIAIAIIIVAIPN